MEKIDYDEFMDVTPDWQGCFNFALTMVESSVPKDSGRDFICEMLRYGQRLDVAKIEENSDS